MALRPRTVPILSLLRQRTRPVPRKPGKLLSVSSGACRDYQFGHLPNACLTSLLLHVQTQRNPAIKILLNSNLWIPINNTNYGPTYTAFGTLALSPLCHALDSHNQFRHKIRNQPHGRELPLKLFLASANFPNCQSTWHSFMLGRPNAFEKILIALSPSRP